MKEKLLALLALTLFALFTLSLIVMAEAQTNTTVWSDNMNYSSLNQLQAAGWTTNNPSGVNFTSSGVTVDQYSGDTSIFYSNHFPSGIVNWTVEDQSRWVSGPHCGNDITATTGNHSYSFMADGWYSEYVFYFDGSKVWTSATGTYSESQGELFTLTIEKSGNQINCYYNSQLEYSYTINDSSQIVSVSAVSPWAGGSEYDYFQLSQPGPSSSAPAPSNVFSNPVVIGGIAGGTAACVGGGIAVAVHYGAMGGSAASSSAGSSAPASATGSTGDGGAASGSGSDVSQGAGSGSGDGGGGGGSSGGGSASSDSNLVAQASNEQMQQMQQVSADQANAQNLSNQMNQDNQNMQNQLTKIQQDTQTKIMDTQQDVTNNRAKTQDKSNQNMDQIIRQASTDSDTTVAEDSGDSGAG